MSNENLTNKRLGHSPRWFNALLLIDVFALGGVVVWRLVLNLLDNMMARSGGGECVGEIPHILDQLLPYWLSYTGVLVLLGLITAGVYLWQRTKPSSV